MQKGWPVKAGSAVPHFVQSTLVENMVPAYCGIELLAIECNVRVFCVKKLSTPLIYLHIASKCNFQHLGLDKLTISLQVLQKQYGA